MERTKRKNKPNDEGERERERSIIYYSAPGQVPLSAIKSNTSRKLYKDIQVQ